MKLRRPFLFVFLGIFLLAGAYLSLVASRKIDFPSKGTTLVTPVVVRAPTNEPWFSPSIPSTSDLEPYSPTFFDRSQQNEVMLDDPVVIQLGDNQPSAGYLQRAYQHIFKFVVFFLLFSRCLTCARAVTST